MKQLDNQIEFVFGGTFDPVHNGHLAIIQAISSQVPDCSIRLIPCSIPPLKSRPATSFEERVVMLTLATENISNIIIDERESLREGASYMVDTLISLSEEFTNKIYILVMGADSVVELSRWHQWQKLPLLCHLLVVNRTGVNSISVNTAIIESEFCLSQDFQKLTQRHSGLAFLLNMPKKAESSTQIRQFRQNNLELDSLLPQSVIKYILEHHLY